MIVPFFSRHGVLGLNARNLLYIKPFNPRKAVAFADDKLKTKAFLAARGIPVAKVYGRIDTRRQLRSYDFSKLPDQCVLKPKFGSGGGGIKVLKGRKDGHFLEQGKYPISYRQLTEHIEDILDGKYSVNGRADTVFFEKILESDPAFAPLRPAGLPDIRIVVFNLVPVMAMLRIPTGESGGKANVHLGGIGIGIDIAKGVTTFATQYNRLIKELPHGGSPAGIVIPGWDDLLLTASRIQYLTNIGYLAVDLTLDREQGPVLLEVNARAGLMVQVANLAPLRSRLERVEGISVQTPEKGVRLAQDLFGAKVPALRTGQEEPQRPVLGTRELISISGAGTTIDVPSLIAPEHERTIFASDLLSELHRTGAVEQESAEERTYRVKFALGGRKLQTVVKEGSVAPASVRAIIGRRDLTGFLIDPTKEAAFSLLRPALKEDLRAIDKFLSQTDHDLQLLTHIKPNNLLEEREKLQVDRGYNPVFTYRESPLNLAEIEARLASLTIEESPTGTLFAKKRDELLRRIALIRALGDAQIFTQASTVLFGSPDAALIDAAEEELSERNGRAEPPETGQLTVEQAATMFRDALDRYGLYDWQTVIRERTIARVTVGGRTVTLRKNARFWKQSLRALIAHEVETHVLTAENGEQQPFELFRRGCAGYLDTQEGMAIFNQNRFLPPDHEKRSGPARNLLGVAFALEHSLAETRRYLEEELLYEPEKALNKALEHKRGLSDTSEPGGFTKGIVYFRGLRAIEQFLSQGGDLKRLYVGKIAWEDVPLVEQVPGLKAPLILPEFLRETA